jgi:TonB family protein
VVGSITLPQPISIVRDQGDLPLVATPAEGAVGRLVAIPDDDVFDGGEILLTNSQVSELIGDGTWQGDEHGAISLPDISIPEEPVRALVGADGSVLKAVAWVSSGDERLDKAALAAAFKCRFSPALQNGQPVALWVTYKVEFVLGQ